MKTNSMKTAGCDLGDRYTHVCVLDGSGEVVEQARIATTRRGFQKMFSAQARLRVVIEVGTHSRWVSALLEQLGHEVVVANPRRLALIHSDRSKSDSEDAEKLARVGRFDVKLLMPIRHRGQQVHVDLVVMKSRKLLSNQRTTLINSVRGILKSFGYVPPQCATSAFAKRIRDQIPQQLEQALVPLLDTIETLTRQLKAYDKAIEALAETAYPDAERLRQVDGVGPLTSLAFILTIEEAKRFEKSRTVGAFLGLSPRKQQSGDRDLQCRISKAGDSHLRQLLVQCAHHVLGPFGKDSDLRRWGLRLVERGGKAAKRRAIVAVARKLAVLLHRLWTTGEDYVAVGYGVR